MTWQDFTSSYNVRVIEVGLAGFLYQLPIWFPDLVVQGFHKNDNFMTNKYSFMDFYDVQYWLQFP